jgi:hypothetical protein
MAAAQNDDLIYVRRSQLEECIQDLVNLKALHVLVIERQKSMVEEKRPTNEELVANLTAALDGVNTLKREFDTMVNGHYRVILPDDDPDSVITLAANAPPQSEGSGDRRMHSQLIRVGPHRELVDWWRPNDLLGRLNGSGPLGDVVRVGGLNDSGTGRGTGRGRPLP